MEERINNLIESLEMHKAKFDNFDSDGTRVMSIIDEAVEQLEEVLTEVMGKE